MAKIAKPEPTPAPAKAAEAPAPIVREEAPAAPAAAEAPKATKAVAKAKSNLPAIMAKFESLQGFGLEEAGAEDYAIPFLNVLQANSPQVGTVPNAAAGDFFATSTKELWGGDDGVEVVPCYYQRRFIEWKPREQGGGFVAIHAPDAPILSKTIRKGHKDVLPNGNEIQNTAQFFLLVKTENGWQPFQFSLKGTQLKKARRWLTMMQGQRMEGANGPFTPPIFAYVYTLQTVGESNDKGRWFGVEVANTVKPATTEAGLVEQAFAFASSIKAGVVKAAAPVDEQPAGTPGAGAGFQAPAPTEGGADGDVY